MQREKDKDMTIKNLLLAVASIVGERDIIDHGAIRCLHSTEVVRSIEQVEDVEEVETNTIGDDDLADRLRELAEDPCGIEVNDLIRLDRVFLGESIDDYIESEEEDELKKLDRLIDAAREL